MPSVLFILFWCSAALIFHNFFGFWLSVRFIALFKRDILNKERESLPSLTVIIPAHNEEMIIAEKLDSVLRQGYPAEKLEIIVASDVSTDRTVEIVHAYVSKGVTLIDFKERHGKLGALDELIPSARGEVVVVTDANVILAPEALKRLANVYSDPRVGAASGYQTVELPHRATLLREEVIYRSFEVNLKKRLSHIGLLVGAFGGFYSLRRSCFKPIGSKPMEDDIILPLEAISQGYRSLFVADAVGYEEIGGTMKEEYRRRVRMTAYNLNAAGRAIKLGARGGLLALYVVISYKVLRWLAPLIWIILAITSALLASHGTVYLAVSATVIGGIGASLIGMIGSIWGRSWGIFSHAWYFAAMNYASFPGLLLWLRGVKRYWAPRAG